MMVSSLVPTSDSLVVVVTLALVVNLGVEAVLVGGVLHVTDLMIGLHHAVKALYLFSVTGFPLLFNVVVFWIMDRVIEMVMWVTL